MKVLELTNYSAGGCGVWKRVEQESELLSKKGHQILILTSNLTKGTDEIVPPEAKLGRINIKRFPAKKLGGESFMFWDFEKAALEFHPDIIIAHSYRHPHTQKALKIGKKIGAKVFLVTHAPFERDNTRNFLNKLIVAFYDRFIGPSLLKKFDRVIAITKWEMVYLSKLGVPEEKIVYIPNGIPEEFFKKSTRKETNTILFMGRVSPIKDLETLISAFSLLDTDDFNLKIIGAAEKEYLKKLQELVEKLELDSSVNLIDKLYNKKEELTELDSAKIYVLPSKSEAMPQTLIEAMAKEKFVISSNNFGSKDLINDNQNGFLFEIGNKEELARKIFYILENNPVDTKKEAKKSVEQFSWKNIINKLEELFCLP